jgi:hypothetical protein
MCQKGRQPRRCILLPTQAAERLVLPMVPLQMPTKKQSMPTQEAERLVLPMVPLVPMN